MQCKSPLQTYQSVSELFPESIGKLLLSIPDGVRSDIHEIGLLEGRPIMFSTSKGIRFGSSFSNIPTADKNIIDEGIIRECFRRFCDYSVHTHQEEIKQGFLSIPGGHRVGLIGTAVIQEGRVIGMRKITGLYFRIARRLDGCAKEIMQRVYQNGLRSLLLVGSPGSGKTTLLRDIARSLSDVPYCYRVSVIDERFEIGAQESIGITCSQLSGFPKAYGILQAVRTLAPEIIVCDEIASQEEIEAAAAGLNSGVFLITSIHANSFEELSRKKQYQLLREIGAIDKIAFLYGRSKPGQVREMV